MPGTLVTTINRFIGTAAERAGMSTTRLPLGSTFFETDTKLQYALDNLEAWQLLPAISATVDDFTILGELTFTPSATQVIDAAGDAILANATLVVLNPDADHTLTSTPTIANGNLGQILYITCDNAEANTVTVQDQDTLASSNLQLLASTKAIAGKTMTSLIFDGTNWIEFGGGAGSIPVAATTVTGSFTGFTSAESKTVDITSISSDNPVIRRVSLWISNDPTGDENINCRLSFYTADSMTEDELLNDFFLNLTYTETNGGASATDTTDTVDDISGLTKYDLIRYMGGTAENVRLTAVPTGTTLTFTALANAHADDTGIVRVAEITEMFQLFDGDSSNEIHIKLETLSAPNASMNVAISIDVQ